MINLGPIVGLVSSWETQKDLKTSPKPTYTTVSGRPLPKNKFWFRFSMLAIVGLPLMLIFFFFFSPTISLLATGAIAITGIKMLENSYGK